MTASTLYAREAQLKMQINALDTWFKATMATLNEELDAVRDERLAQWDAEIAEFDRQHGEPA